MFFKEGIQVKYTSKKKSSRVLRFLRELRGDKIEIAFDIERKTPAISDEKNRPKEVYETYAYDALGNRIKITDSQRNQTHISYTSRGQPTLIAYPDGTTDRFTYRIDGMRESYTNRQDITLFFSYDFLGRITEKAFYGSDGTHLYTKQYLYNTFHLLAEIDEEGFATTYEYDNAGRLIKEAKGETVTTYTYDGKGRQKDKIQWLEGDRYIREERSYDVLDRVTEQATYDENEDLQTITKTQYNDRNQPTCVITTSQNAPSITRTTYNSRGDKTQVVDPSGNTTFFHYDDNHYNALGQAVRKILRTDPNGVQTEAVNDAYGRPIAVIRKNSYGQEWQKHKTFYDPLGNQTHRIDYRYQGDDPPEEIHTFAEYNFAGDRIRLVEAARSSDQRTTEYEYSPNGELFAIRRMHGSTLFHQYDPYGRLEAMHSEDSSIHYTYQYDRKGNSLLLKDEKTGRETHRAYTLHGELAQDSLDNGQLMRYQYDEIGRPHSVTLPDGTGWKYAYRGIFLHMITRIQADGQESYSHTYAEYTPMGHATQEQLVGNVGTLTKSYDASGRTLSIVHPHWKEENIVYDCMGNITERRITDTYKGKREERHDQYAYDLLDQLQEERGIVHHSYQYDSLHNRTRKDGEDYHCNALHQLVQYGETRCHYDFDGNLLQQEGKKEVTCEYDALNRLCKVITPEGEWEYQYDAFHRRTAKVHRGKREEYLYVDQKEIGALQQGEIHELRLLGSSHESEAGATIAIEVKGKLYAPIHDHLGNICCLIDAKKGTVAETIRLTAYGEEITQTDSPLHAWRFSGKRRDPETGWIYFLRRYYDPDRGRWLTADPAGYLDSPNRYAYVQNRPLVGIDPFGLWTFLISTGPIPFGLKLGEILPFVWYNWTGNFPAIMIAGILVGLARGEYHFQGSSHYTIEQFRKEYPEPPTFSDLRREGKQVRENPRVGIGIINGVGNNQKDSYECAQALSEQLGGYNVRWTTNPSHGIIADLLEAGLNLGGMLTSPAQKLQEMWQNFFDNAPDGSVFIQVCHSQGAAHVRNALRNSPPEFRERIHVIAIAPCAYISDKLCGSVKHYVSTSDIVPRFDFLGRMLNRHTITYLERKSHTSGFFDHEFSSPTYRDSLVDEVNKLSEKYRGI